MSNITSFIKKYKGKGINMKEINTINWNQKCWHYFKVDKFISSLMENHMYFAAANEFEDNFEGASTLHSIDSVPYIPDSLSSIPHISSMLNLAENAFRNLQELTKINCWHKADYESDAMWKLYAQERKGIAICTTPEKMRKAFKPFRLKPEYCIEEINIGNVQYIDLTDNHIDDTMLNMYFYKHLVYLYENELRLVVSLRIASEFGVEVPKKGIFVQVDYNELIDEIIIGPNISNNDREKLYFTCKNLGLDSKLKDSCLTLKPRFI